MNNLASLLCLSFVAFTEIGFGQCNTRAMAMVSVGVQEMVGAYLPAVMIPPQRPEWKSRLQLKVRLSVHVQGPD